MTPKLAKADPDPLPEESLVFGIALGPRYIDPHYAYEAESLSTIDQVIESLFAYDLSDSDHKIIPRLAANYGIWSLDKLNYTVQLRQGVNFHDGSVFNATAVQWNFERLAYLANFTGELPVEKPVTQIESLYRWVDGTPIINRTEQLDIYSVRFVLNRPFAALEGLLSCWGSGILSPLSTPPEDYIDTGMMLIGTGPFVYDYYDEGYQVKFHAYENYWAGEADIKDLTFLIIEDSFERNQAMLDGVIDILEKPDQSMLDIFEADPYIVVETGLSSICRYLHMNNQLINKTMRQAVSYSIDYTYIYEEIYDGVRLKSPVPEGILYANGSFNAAIHDIYRARQILVDDRVCDFDIYNDVSWLETAQNNPIDTYNYYMIPGVQTMGSIGNLLQGNLAQIGIHLNVETILYEEWVSKLYDSELQIYQLGWGPDYNDPSNIINTQFSVGGIANHGQVNDATLEDLMQQGLNELDPNVRERIYDEIQRYLVEDLMPSAFLLVQNRYNVYSINVYGFQTNSLGKYWFYTVSLQDLTPPETNLEARGILGFDGYYMSNVTVELWGEDDLSGIKRTEYSFNELDWVEYTDPFEITNQGSTLIYYRSIDNADNVEVSKSTIIEIQDRPENHPAVIFAPNNVPYELDPHYVWDSNAYKVIDQVAETLFAHDFNIPNNPIVPRLAADYGTWSPDGLTYTVSLRSGIHFHDGDYFDAWDVEWNFNRLFYFMNMTGELTRDLPISMFESLFKWPDGTPIIDHIEIVNSETIDFILTRPFAALEGLLALSNTAILSPVSTPEDSYINVDYDTLVGTGPFRFIEYNGDSGVRFYRNDNYWQGPVGINELWFLDVQDYNEKQDAFQRGVIDFLDDPSLSLLDVYESDPDITVEGGSNAVIYYLGMNNNLINQTMRQAISHAINYTYIIDEIFSGDSSRLRSPLPLGIPYAAWDYDPAIFNITKAREILVDSGVCDYDIIDDQMWIDNPIITYNHTYLFYSIIQTRIANDLGPMLELIGIDLILVPMEWSELIQIIYENRDKLELFFMGWGADYGDPIVFINQLLSNDSPNNWAQVDDPYLQGLIDQGLIETDRIARGLIYEEIQRYCVEELMPWAFTNTGYDLIAYQSIFAGYQWNELDKVWFYTVVTPDWIPPETYIDAVGVYSFDGYYFSNVSVYLWADDWDSGVASIQYSFNEVDWIEYSESFIISDEGTTFLYYRSIDYNGNVEDTKIEVIEIHPRSTDDQVVIYGLSDDLYTIDPHDSWGGTSTIVFDQVVETLFAYDLSDPQMKIIPRLAADYGTWTPDGLTYTVPLRTGITFHDGTPFDAWAVQWNAWRLGYFMNITGTLPPDQHRAFADSLYRHPDGTPIITAIDVLDPYTVRYTLSEPFAAIDALLCFEGSGILSPSSTPFENYLDRNSDGIVGTGPFIYDQYLINKGIQFHSNEEYWQGPPTIKELWFLIIGEAVERNNALIDGNIDFLSDPLESMLETFDNDPDIIVEGGQGLIMYYLGMNNNKINQTMRQSISYAINYTHILDNILHGTIDRLKSPLPQGLRYANWSFTPANLDVIHARQILVDNGVCDYDINNPVVWIDAANNNPIAIYTLPVLYGSTLISELGNILVDNLEKIGIQVILDPIEWGDFIYRIFFEPDTIDLFYMGWGPDYNDPYVYINSLLSNDFPNSNWAHVDDPYLQGLIDQGISEINPVTREQIYDEIQRYCVEDLMPWAYLYVRMQYDAYNSKFLGYQWNPMDKIWFYSVIAPDNSPPETWIEVRGIIGFDGWYVSNVTIELWADDDNSGVDYTEYSFNTVDWFTYIDPLEITDNGVTIVYYRSVDNDGNIEEYKTESVEKLSRPINDPMFIVGSNGELADLDPHNAWDSASYNVFYQVIETLFRVNLSDPEYEIIPYLAADYGTWSPDGLIYTIPLKSGITFHDGTIFDANAVIWTFDRLNYFMNETGLLPSWMHPPQFESVLRWPDGTPIINHVEFVDTQIVSFVLNKPFGAFESLLTFEATSILSPTSTPENEYIDRYTGDLIGTGPFVYDEYRPGIGVRFHRYDKYWQGLAKIKNMTFLYIPDLQLRNEALIKGVIDFLDNPDNTLLENFESDPSFVVDGGKSTVIYYISMNNNYINKTMRQGISYSINYTHIIDILMNGFGERLKSPIPEGIPYANTTLDAATYDILRAREILVNAGVCTFDIYNDAQWLTAAEQNPLGTYTYTYNIGSFIRENLGILLENTLPLIGVELILEPVDIGEFFDRLVTDPNSIQISFLGWGPDYVDPSTFINSLYSNISITNYAQVNDPYLQDLMEQALIELDPINRKVIYNEIQRYLVEDLMPFAYIVTPLSFDVYNAKFTGYQWNPYNILIFHGLYQPSVSVETETGENIEVIDPIHDVIMTYDSVTASGTTTITVSNTGPEIPIGFELNGMYYEITTTTTYTGLITLFLTYDELQVVGDEANLKLMHYNETTELWEDVTTWVDIINNIIYGEVSSLSTFAVIEMVDGNAPITTHELTGTLGNLGWYITDVVVTLTATDDLSGVAITEYSLNGVNWEEYIGPFNLEIEGETKVYYRSIDIAGNVEDTRLVLILIDKTAPETELVIMDCFIDEDGNILVSYNSTFVIVALDLYSGVVQSFYRINGSEWIEFITPFNLTGVPGEYIIEYYSIDVAGNIETTNSTIVILETEFDQVIEGYGMLRVNGQRLVGSATLSISDETILLEIEDHVATWEVTDHTEMGNMEIYIGESEIGRIKVIIITCGERTFVIAYGTGVFFFGYG